MYLEVDIAPPLKGAFKNPLRLRLFSNAFAILKDFASQHFQHQSLSFCLTVCSIFLLFKSLVIPAYQFPLFTYKIELSYTHLVICALMLLYVFVCVGGINFDIVKNLNNQYNKNKSFIHYRVRCV